MWTTYKKLFTGVNLNTVIFIANKSHYESLNIPKTATHKEIKDAYYRLSMIYHPDKNKGSEEAANNFRDITAAYEILGNVRQRKLYDSGATPNQTNSQYRTKQPFKTMNTKSNVNKNSVRSREYNFDQWSKSHYSDVFQRQYNAREMIARKKCNEEYLTRHNTYSLLTIMVFLSCFILFIMFEELKKIMIERETFKKFDEKSIQGD